MLNDTVVKIDEVEAAIGCVVDIDGTEAFVGGCEEFLLAEWVGSFDVAIEIVDFDGLDHLGTGFTDERPAVEFFREVGTAIDHGTTSSGAVGQFKGLGVDGIALVAIEAGDVGSIKPRRDSAGVNGIAADPLSDTDLHFDALVSLEEIGENSVSDKHGAVGVEKEAPEVVLADAPLTTEGSGFFDELAVLKFVSVSGLGIIHPIVDGGHHPVGLVLHVAALGILGIKYLGFVLGFIVIVFDEVEILLVTEEDAAGDDGDGARKEDVVQEDGAFIDGSISGRVFEDDDAALWLVFGGSVNVGHVTAHFANPHTSTGVEGESDWFVDERLGDNRLDHEVFMNGEGLEGFVDIQDWSGRDEPVGDDLGHVFMTFAVSFLSVGPAKGE